MGEKNAQTTTQSSAPNPAAMKAYQDLMNRASGVAATPYNPYGGDLTAGVNAQQNLGIGNINTASQAGNPWFSYAASMAHPLAQSDIERYQNPYTQNVVDATQAQFDRSNAQQQEGLKGRAISQGSLGGSRANIAAADLGYQQNLGQAPVIAGLYNNSYQQALAAAQQQQQAGFQGAGVGANIQQAGIQGAGAQIGAGTLEQQTEQARINALYGQYQQAQAFPYQQTQWLAGIDTGVGSQMGGTSTTTAPAPSVLGQVAGLGLAGLGVAGGLGYKPFGAWRGGGVGSFDAGGSVGAEPYGGVGFIPHMQIARGHGAPQAPHAADIPHPSFDPKNFAFPRAPAGVGPVQLDPYATAGAGVGDINPMAPQSGLGPIYYCGGGVHGYADGGSPLGFDDRWNGAPADTMEQPSIAGVAGNEDAPIDRSRLPRQFFDADAGPSNEMAYAPTAAGVAPAQMPPAYNDGAYDASRASVAGIAPKAGFDWSSLSMPLMAAGLGMMASRSPHPGVAIGEGGLAGVQAYAAQKRETAEQGLAERKQALDARRLDQMAQQSRDHLALQTRQQQFSETGVSAAEKARLQQTRDQHEAQLAEQKRQHDIAAGAPQVIPYGAGVMNKSGQWIREPGIGEGSDYDPTPPDAPSGSAPVKPPAMAGTTSEALAQAGEQYALTGKLGPGYNNMRDPIVSAQSRAAKSYGVALARSRGIEGQELAQMWQNAPRWAGWIMGQDGRAVGALGTAVDHLDTARETFKALNNNDIKLFNSLKNKFKEQFGYEAPTNVHALSQVVGTEVMKAVGAAGAGGEGERTLIAKVVGDLSKSPAQAEGGIDTLQKLIAGQLRTKQRQADAIDLPKGKFEKLVGQRGLDVLGSIDKKPETAANRPTISTREEFNALPSGAEYIRDGKPYRKP